MIGILDARRAAVVMRLRDLLHLYAGSLGRRLNATSHAQFLQDGVNVVLDCRHGNSEGLRNLLVRESLG